MTNTNQDTSELKRHRKLNTEQVAILQLLYKFRFASSKQIATYQQKQGSKPVQKRLKILEDQMLISKHYDKTYKLRGKPAAYYLLPRGARAFALHTDRPSDHPINMKRIYQDKDVSENFIEHCLNILDFYLKLKARYPKEEALDYFTKSRLNYEQYDYFPSPLPDGYIRIKMPEGEKDFFLDIFEDTQPYFVLVRRIKKYLSYSRGGDWDDTMPTVLIACATTSVQKRLRKQIVRLLNDSYEEVTFATTTIDAMKSSDAKIWLLLDENGDDPDEPQKPMDLDTLPFGLGQ